MSDSNTKTARPLKADGKEVPKRPRKGEKAPRPPVGRASPRIVAAAQETGRDLAAIRAQVTATFFDMIARRYLPPAPSGETA